LDGHLYPLNPGDSVGFMVGDRLANTLLNSTENPARLLAVGIDPAPTTRSTTRFIHFETPRLEKRIGMKSIARKIPIDRLWALTTAA
jgi:uncharacterized cupin superfamily protein